MKSHHNKTAIILASLIGAGALSLVADEPPDPRLTQIQGELKLRKTQREEAVQQRGVICAPVFTPENWFGPARPMRIEDEQIATCAQSYAILIGKEIMVSNYVAKRRISIPEGAVSFKEFAEAIRHACIAQGVIEVPIGDRIIALVDSNDLKK